MPTKITDKTKAAANKVAKELNTDVFLYNGPIERGFDDDVLKACKERGNAIAPNILLIMVTEGGNPDAAFRIAKFFQYHYDHFVFLANGYCKSAGTLVAVGANELVLSINGELGPIDVQLSKRDDLVETQSTQVIVSGLTGLAEKAFSAYEYFFLETQKKSEGRITLKTATDIAVKLTAGLFAPIFQQIDPMLVGENIRVATLANQYGARLHQEGKNLKSLSSLDYLVAGYGTHGFVIDVDECKLLFREVREPSNAEQELCEELGSLSTIPTATGSEFIGFLSDTIEEEADASNAQNGDKGE